MSYIPCIYCHEIALKTDGNGNAICKNRAETGSCEDEEFDIEAYKRAMYDRYGHETPTGRKPKHHNNALPNVKKNRQKNKQASKSRKKNRKR